MIFHSLPQPLTLLNLHSHPTQYEILFIKHLSFWVIRVFLQLVHRLVRGIPVRRAGRRIMMLITQCVIIVVRSTPIL